MAAQVHHAKVRFFMLVQPWHPSCNSLVTHPQAAQPACTFQGLIDTTSLFSHAGITAQGVSTSGSKWKPAAKMQPQQGATIAQPSGELLHGNLTAYPWHPSCNSLVTHPQAAQPSCTFQGLIDTTSLFSHAGITAQGVSTSGSKWKPAAKMQPQQGATIAQPSGELLHGNLTAYPWHPSCNSLVTASSSGATIMHLPGSP